MPQIHLRAEPGDYAPLVLLPGDPRPRHDDRRTVRRRPRNTHARQPAPLAARLHRHVQRQAGQRPDERHGHAVLLDRHGRAAHARREALHPDGHLRWHRPRPEDRRPSRCHRRRAGRRRDADLPARRSICSGRRLRADPGPGRHGAARRASSRYVGVVQSVDVFYNPDADYASKMRSRAAWLPSRWRRRRCSTWRCASRAAATTCAAAAC